MIAGEILRAAAELIGQPGAWTQDYYAKSVDGLEVWATSDSAVCWCMDGALRRVGLGKRGYDDAIHHLVEACATARGWTGRDAVHKWNDAPDRTQAECVAKLLVAAERAERGAP
jgi:hypothetical protein